MTRLGTHIALYTAYIKMSVPRRTHTSKAYALYSHGGRDVPWPPKWERRV